MACCTRSRPDRHPAHAHQMGRPRRPSPQDAPALVGSAFRELSDPGGRGRSGSRCRPTCWPPRAEVELHAAAARLSRSRRSTRTPIARAAELLAKAERPVIFVGGGANEAAAEVRALAERLTAPVVAYRRGKGVLDERHPLSHALPGGHALWAQRRCGAGGRHAPAAADLGAGASTTSSTSSRSTSTASRDGSAAQARDRPRRRCAPRCSRRLTEHLAPSCRRCGRIASRASRARQGDASPPISAVLAPQLGYLQRDPRRAAGQRRRHR